ncbi:MAG: hypothetical protein JW744_00630 [Candidatus Diapherotrites archaeon]|uniref:Class III signal peptide-containing protein n=1 Tax=Candidatus Iainarchaeum sp. TaxID=3101447 RepID=A0A938YWH0_9ARCH|nr:hypothetical protein [Candidatus Diapherotrites archaeon]
MHRRAQAGLEYLITYSWALVVVATVVGLLVFALGNMGGGITCNSSDPSKVILKAYAIDSANQNIRLQNATGGDIKLVPSVVGSGTGFTSGGHVVVQGVSATVISGGTFEIIPSCEGGCTSGLVFAGGTLVLNYTDMVGFTRSVTISCDGKIP